LAFRMTPRCLPALADRFSAPRGNSPTRRPRQQHSVERPPGEADSAATCGEDFESIGLYTEYRAPSPIRRTVFAQRSPGECGQNIAGKQRVGPVASRAAKRVGCRDIAHCEHFGVAGNPQICCHADESVFVKHLRRQPAGVGPHPPYRPQHRVGRYRRLPGAPLHRFTGDLVAVEDRRG
jgi:hypothetical protein